MVKGPIPGNAGPELLAGLENPSRSQSGARGYIGGISERPKALRRVNQNPYSGFVNGATLLAAKGYTGLNRWYVHALRKNCTLYIYSYNTPRGPKTCNLWRQRWVPLVLDRLSLEMEPPGLTSSKLLQKPTFFVNRKHFSRPTEDILPVH